MSGYPPPSTNWTEPHGLPGVRPSSPFWLYSHLLVCFLCKSILAFNSTRQQNICFLARAQQSSKSQFHRTQTGGVLLRIDHPRIPGPARILHCVDKQVRSSADNLAKWKWHMWGMERVAGKEEHGYLLAFAISLVIILTVAKVGPWCLDNLFFFNGKGLWRRVRRKIEFQRQCQNCFKHLNWWSYRISAMISFFTYFSFSLIGECGFCSVS